MQLNRPRMSTTIIITNKKMILVDIVLLMTLVRERDSFLRLKLSLATGTTVKEVVLFLEALNLETLKLNRHHHNMMIKWLFLI